MVVDSDLREVNFEKYCIICKHAECPEHEDPCFECLDNPLNYCTEKPVKCAKITLWILLNFPINLADRFLFFIYASPLHIP